MHAITKSTLAALAVAAISACGPTQPTGAGGTTSAGGTGGTGGSSNPGAPPCITSPNQVVIIGDSFINWPSHTLLLDLAREAGETWRNYSVGGASLATGGISTLIPDQFQLAKAADPNIKAVVMDGGGNDVLLCDTLRFPGCQDCKNNANAATVKVCQDVVQAALQKAREGITIMANAGVKDVIYFFYPNVPLNTLIGGANPNPINAYALPQAKEVCDNAINQSGGRLRCHFIDMIPVFQGHPDYFALGDIHPNAQGSAAMAKAIVGVMKRDCVGQHNTCCSG